MKKAFAILLALLLFGGIAFAADKPVRFQWDYDQTAIDQVASFELFMRLDDAAYDYEGPLIDIPKTAPNTTAGTTITYDDKVLVQIPDGAMGVLHFVMRAKDENGNQSGDSNEVHYPFDTQAPPAVLRFQLIIEAQ